MNENNVYEIEVCSVSEHWRKVSWFTFRSWPGRRRVNGQEFHGRVFYFMSPKVWN